MRLKHEQPKQTSQHRAVSNLVALQSTNHHHGMLLAAGEPNSTDEPCFVQSTYWMVECQRWNVLSHIWHNSMSHVLSQLIKFHIVDMLGRVCSINCQQTLLCKVRSKLSVFASETQPCTPHARVYDWSIHTPVYTLYGHQTKIWGRRFVLKLNRIYLLVAYDDWLEYQVERSSVVNNMHHSMAG